MYLKAFAPDPALRPYISRYLYIRLKSGQFHFPADGCPGFIINLREPFLLGFDKDHLKPLTGCRIFGSSTRYLLSRHMMGQTELLAVKYRPGQLTRFFDIPAVELTDTSASLMDLCGVYGRGLEEKLCEARRIPELVKMLDDTLVNCLSHDHTHDQRIVAALDAIIQHKGQLRIQSLATELGLSRRHFERRFLDVVGLTPKRMCRISRFLGVFGELQENQGHDWADHAYAGGYSDQAHLIRECKYFTGHSPLAYLKDRSFLERAILGDGKTD